MKHSVKLSSENAAIPQHNRLEYETGDKMINKDNDIEKQQKQQKQLNQYRKESNTENQPKLEDLTKEADKIQEDERVEEKFVMSSNEKLEHQEPDVKKIQHKEKLKASAPVQKNSDDEESDNDSFELYEVNFRAQGQNASMYGSELKPSSSQIQKTSSDQTQLHSSKPPISQSQKKSDGGSNAEKNKSSLLYSPMSNSNNNSKIKIWSDNPKPIESTQTEEEPFQQHEESKISQKFVDKNSETISTKNPHRRSGEKVKSAGNPNFSIIQRTNVDANKIDNESSGDEIANEPGIKVQSQYESPQLQKPSAVSPIKQQVQEQIKPQTQQQDQRQIQQSGQKRIQPESESRGRKQSPKQLKNNDFMPQQRQGYAQVPGSQQQFYPSPYAQPQYGSPHQQMFGAGFPFSTPLSPVMNPYQFPGSPGYFWSTISNPNIPIYTLQKPF